MQHYWYYCWFWDSTAVPAQECSVWLGMVSLCTALSLNSENVPDKNEQGEKVDSSVWWLLNLILKLWSTALQTHSPLCVVYSSLIHPIESYSFLAILQHPASSKLKLITLHSSSSSGMHFSSLSFCSRHIYDWPYQSRDWRTAPPNYTLQNLS